MEGLTGYLFRNTHHELFPGIDRYYSPFLSANHNFSFQGKEKEDVAPENNRELTLIPQLLTKHAEEFVWGVRTLGKAGYREVNLNLGCPSSTVSAKGKGAGFLAYPAELDAFFKETFLKLTDSGEDPAVSVKTRIGYADPSEAARLMEIYNRYPIAELIIHARVRNAMYNGTADTETFAGMYGERSMPVCYNGDIRTAADFDRIADRFPDLHAVMIGRALIRNPALVREIGGGAPLAKQELKRFHDTLFRRYTGHYSERICVGRMKELWYYWEDLFVRPDGPFYDSAAAGMERMLRNIKKSVGKMEYIAAAGALLGR